MCKPRRVSITATRELAESWRREVSRTVQLSGQVQGEARVCQSLAATLAEPVLRGIEMALDRGLPGWRPVEGGFRHEVEGGYVLYDPDRRCLEIVALAEACVTAEGKAEDLLTGQVEQTLSTAAEGQYYEDGWGGRTQEVAEAEARKAAEEALTRQSSERVKQAADQAEAAAAANLEARAQAEAARRLKEETDQRRAALSAQAAQHLDTVGVRARQAANRLFAEGYRDAIVAYARTHGGDNVQCRDGTDTLEIQFTLSR